MKSMLFTIAGLLVCSNALAANPTDGLPPTVFSYHLAVTEGSCDTDLPEESQAYDLGNGSRLYIVPCFMGAYQSSARAYIGKGNSVEPVIVLGYDERTNGVSGSLDLTDAGYDPKTQQLTTFARGRGAGDCGQSSVSKVIADEYSAAVKTIEVRAKSKCDGNLSRWPIVFRQK